MSRDKTVGELLAQLTVEQDGEHRQALANAIRLRIVELMIDQLLRQPGIKCN